MTSSSPSDLPHGRSRYSNLGCRCEVCREDWRVYVAGYRRRNRPYLLARRRARHRSRRLSEQGIEHDFEELLAEELERGQG